MHTNNIEVYTSYSLVYSYMVKTIKMIHRVIDDYFVGDESNDDEGYYRGITEHHKSVVGLHYHRTAILQPVCFCICVICLLICMLCLRKCTDKCIEYHLPHYKRHYRQIHHKYFICCVYDPESHSQKHIERMSVAPTVWAVHLPDNSPVAVVSPGTFRRTPSD
ncbi:hypothetical protein AALO_G00219040 [Alosa alosa]|uniref:Uncharacterized protein n=1 Tax=Alosa alosa TaxID=278164 RepID=A0AAV6FWJ7_9TELE|nr:hypothetical protein AALO_G00219040 [Alosa alosa]